MGPFAYLTERFRAHRPSTNKSDRTHTLDNTTDDCSSPVAAVQCCQPTRAVDSISAPVQHVIRTGSQTSGGNNGSACMDMQPTACCASETETDDINDSHAPLAQLLSSLDDPLHHPPCADISHQSNPEKTCSLTSTIPDLMITFALDSLQGQRLHTQPNSDPTPLDPILTSPSPHSTDLTFQHFPCHSPTGRDEAGLREPGLQLGASAAPAAIPVRPRSRGNAPTPRYASAFAAAEAAAATRATESVPPSVPPANIDRAVSPGSVPLPGTKSLCNILHRHMSDLGSTQDSLAAGHVYMPWVAITAAAQQSEGPVEPGSLPGAHSTAASLAGRWSHVAQLHPSGMLFGWDPSADPEVVAFEWCGPGGDQGREGFQDVVHMPCIATGKDVGRGGFGSVCLAYSLHDGRTLAAKTVRTTTARQLAAVHQEARVGMALRHPHLVCTWGFITVPCGHHALPDAVSGGGGRSHAGPLPQLGQPSAVMAATEGVLEDEVHLLQVGMMGWWDSSHSSPSHDSGATRTAADGNHAHLGAPRAPPVCDTQSQPLPPHLPVKPFPPLCSAKVGVPGIADAGGSVGGADGGGLGGASSRSSLPCIPWDTTTPSLSPLGLPPPASSTPARSRFLSQQGTPTLPGTPCADSAAGAEGVGPGLGAEGLLWGAQSLWGCSVSGPRPSSHPSGRLVHHSSGRIALQWEEEHEDEEQAEEAEEGGALPPDLSLALSNLPLAPLPSASLLSATTSSSPAPQLPSAAPGSGGSCGGGAAADPVPPLPQPPIHTHPSPLPSPAAIPPHTLPQAAPPLPTPLTPIFPEDCGRGAEWARDAAGCDVVGDVGVRDVSVDDGDVSAWSATTDSFCAGGGFSQGQCMLPLGVGGVGQGMPGGPRLAEVELETCLYQELAPHGDLCDHLQRVMGDQAAGGGDGDGEEQDMMMVANLMAHVLPLVLGAARGLAHMHGQRYVHGDVKARNVLVYSEAHSAHPGTTSSSTSPSGKTLWCITAATTSTVTPTAAATGAPFPSRMMSGVGVGAAGKLVAEQLALRHARAQEEAQRGEPASFSAKLCDFGLAVQMGEGRECADGLGGTQSHMAPEAMLLHKPRVSYATDVYAFGVTLWEAAEASLQGGEQQGEAPAPPSRTAAAMGARPQWRTLLRPRDALLEKLRLQRESEAEAQPRGESYSCLVEQGSKDGSLPDPWCGTISCDGAQRGSQGGDTLQRLQASLSDPCTQADYAHRGAPHDMCNATGNTTRVRGGGDRASSDGMGGVGCELRRLVAQCDAYMRLAQCCWAHNPSQRPTMQEVVLQLEALACGKKL